MPCYSPLQAWRGRLLESGKRSIVFKAAQREPALVDAEMRLPCGRCVGCLLERGRQWAVRCMCEAQLHDRNCFVTLTYDDPHLPQGGGLVLSDWQLFMKRLRKFASQDSILGGENKFKVLDDPLFTVEKSIVPAAPAAAAAGIRYFMCGEYGELRRRPHFHACLFNWDFEDKVLWSVRGDVRLYRSPRLEKLWGKGFASVGDVTFESAGYVARYILKKVSGVVVEGESVDPSNGVCVSREFTTMSRRPGIGKGWFDRFKNDLYPGDYHVVRGVKCKPARYFDSLYEREDPTGFSDVKARRNSGALRVAADNDSFRLPVKEGCVKARIKLLRRPLEEGS